MHQSKFPETANKVCRGARNSSTPRSWRARSPPVLCLYDGGSTAQRTSDERARAAAPVRLQPGNARNSRTCPLPYLLPTGIRLSVAERASACKNSAIICNSRQAHSALFGFQTSDEFRFRSCNLQSKAYSMANVLTFIIKQKQSMTRGRAQQ